MIIGFLHTNIEELRFFKSTVTHFPLYGYVFYCDTKLASNKSTVSNRDEVIAEGVSFLLVKGCTVVVVENEQIQEKVAEAYKNIVVLTQPMLSSYLEGVVSQEIQSTTRIVHLTQHTKESDQIVAEILGGYFIK